MADIFSWLASAASHGFFIFAALFAFICLLAVWGLRKNTEKRGSREEKIPPAGVWPEDRSIVTTASHSEAGKDYALNVSSMACTCPDWLKRRSSLDRRHPGRMCKHLTEYFARKQVEIPPELQRYRGLIKKRGDAFRGMPAPDKNTLVEYGEVKGVVYALELERDGFPWVNIVTAEGRFGYNTDERRWARGETPASEPGELAKKAKMLAGG